MIFMINLENYPRLQNENDDSPRIMRAVTDAPGSSIFIPEGVYEIATTLKIDNNCSLRMDPFAILKAVKEMDYVIKWIGAISPDSKRYPRNMFISGGQIDACGLASCLYLQNYVHITLRDMTFTSGKKYGLCVGPEGHGVELIANNLYFSNTVAGLQGNIGIYTSYTDGHFTDIVIVDYSIGVYDDNCCSNRYTRVHVWCGSMQVDGVPQYLKGSINFVIKGSNGAGEVILRDCYADTGEIGFDLYCTARLYGCSYYNNYEWLKFDNVLCIRNNTTEPIHVFEGCWSKESPNTNFYQGFPGENIVFRDNIFRGGLTLS